MSVAAANNARTGNVTIPARTEERRTTTSTTNTKADEIINTALSFSGTRYKFGGTTKKGMDCSGLLYVSFGEHDVQIPRVSYNMAEEGRRIAVKNVEKGDLLFFKTSRGSKRINHVGMVVGTDNNEITFIHASSSRGVTVSSLRDGFWNQAFVKATRIL
ncbi:MAG: C40 family peptidase [Maribacter sp.]